MPAPTYTPAKADVELVITDGATIPAAVGSRYTHGDRVNPFNVANATLRSIAQLDRTAAGRVSANAKKAKAEIARRKLNAAAQKAV